MEFIAHRINTVKELRKPPPEYGVELDLRDSLDGSIIRLKPETALKAISGNIIMGQ